MPGSPLDDPSTDAPLLLVTDYPPDARGGGAVILRSLLAAGHERNVLWLTLTQADIPVTPGVVAEHLVLRRGSHGLSRERKRSVILDQTLLARALRREVLQIASAKGAVAAWVVLHGAAVQLAEALARDSTLRVHVTVHDDPAFALALRSRRYRPLTRWIARRFAAALFHADSVDVVSEQMAERYRRLHGVNAVVVHRAMDSPIAPSAPYDAEKHGLRVGVLGSTYGYGQLPLLARAVASAAAELRVAGRLLIIGRGHGRELAQEMRGVVDVDVTGHLDEEEAIARLRDCFSLYLNYPFAKRDAVLRQTSFPTKLTTYIQAARPLLLHVPSDSSVMPLLEDTGYTRHWGSLSVSDGSDLLVHLWKDPRAFESCHEAADVVRQRYFDGRRNRKAIFGALDALASP